MEHRDKNPPLAVPVRDPAKAHPDYQPGGPLDPATSGTKTVIATLREHQDSLRFRLKRPLTRKEAGRLYPIAEVIAYFGMPE